MRIPSGKSKSIQYPNKKQTIVTNAISLYTRLKMNDTLIGICLQKIIIRAINVIRIKKAYTPKTLVGEDPHFRNM